MSAEREQGPLPAIRLTHYATATALEALEKQREAQWAAQHDADEEHVELCEECLAELDSGSECVDGSWLCVNCWPQAAQEAADVVAVEAYEASVQHRLSDLRHEGTWWTYGHVDPLHQGDERQGWGCWLECTVGRESDTGVWLSEPDEHSWEGAADEPAARTEATRRNWGEQEDEAAAQTTCDLCGWPTAGAGTCHGCRWGGLERAEQRAVWEQQS